MSVLESVRVALGMLRLHKLRAFLTMLGVIIGVMSVTTIIMLSKGFEVFLTREFDTLAPDGMFLFYDPSRADRGERVGRFDAITHREVEFLRDRVPRLGVISGVFEGPPQMVRSGDRESRDTRVNGIDANHNLVINKELLEGRLIDERDVELKANVAVISDALRDHLFPEGGALGRMLIMEGITLEVIGVVKEEQSALQFGGQQPRRLEMPVTTAQRKWVGGRSYSYLMLRPDRGENVQRTMDDVWQALMALTGNRPVFRLDSNESILNTFTGIIAGAGAILAAVAALSLLVGGIGIMNIMLVSVTERTREIGLRKAVGGKSASILTQFLVEAAVLSLVGGLIGMGIAFGLGQVVTLVTTAAQFPNPDGLSAPFPPLEALMIAAFSALIGMVFGFFPAVSAAKLDPIEALRRE